MEKSRLTLCRLIETTPQFIVKNECVGDWLDQFDKSPAEQLRRITIEIEVSTQRLVDLFDETEGDEISR